MNQPSTCLYITNAYDAKKWGGRELVSDLNRRILAELFGERLAVYEIDRRTSLLRKAANTLSGRTDGVSARTLREIAALLRTARPDYVFFNGSGFGPICRRIAKRFPEVHTITFCHNVESKFFEDAYAHSRSLKSWLLSRLYARSERMVLRHSRTVVCLNDRDRQLFTALYGRRPEWIAPLCLKDFFPASGPAPRPARQRPVGLFVGGCFFSNFYGVKWFLEKVAPFVDAELLVVGRGFENVRDRLPALPNVRIVGGTDDLVPYYLAADFIFSPIFDGSGMKTKTAEAFMFGKTLFGTKEAFEGYDAEPKKAGARCDDAESFIRTINGYPYSDATFFNAYNRERFVAEYSFEAQKRRFRQIFNA